MKAFLKHDVGVNDRREAQSEFRHKGFLRIPRMPSTERIESIGEIPSLR